MKYTDNQIEFAEILLGYYSRVNTAVEIKDFIKQANLPSGMYRAEMYQVVKDLIELGIFDNIERRTSAIQISSQGREIVGEHKTFKRYIDYLNIDEKRKSRDEKRKSQLLRLKLFLNWKLIVVFILSLGYNVYQYWDNHYNQDDVIKTEIKKEAT